MRHAVLGLTTALALVSYAGAGDGLRVAQWNITDYSGGQTANIQTVVYAEFQGRSLDADLFLLEEFLSQSALNSFVSALNTAPGSPGDWVGATFYSGASGGLNTTLAYRESKLDLLGSELVSPGSTTENPRNIVRYDMRLDGYNAEETTISCYPVHMKAGSSGSNQSRRLLEAIKIRSDAETLPAGRHFMIGGDFNIQSSSQLAYQEMTGNQADNSGRVLDPIATPGSWNNNFTYRNIHTQDPVGGGGMDDRLDQILVSAGFGDGVGLEYVGQFQVPWNLATPVDPNHSYRCWGNDGTSYNTRMTTTGNTMVGPSIAQAIISLAGNTGHCPVYLDLVVPAKVGVSTLVLDFGSVVLGDSAVAGLTVSNAGDTAKWGEAGIEDLVYQLVTTGGISAASGFYMDPAGGGGIGHPIVADTSAIGPINGTLFVDSNDPDQPLLEVTILGEVVGPPCPADLAAPFGVLDLSDVNAFTGAFIGGGSLADIAEPFGVLDLFDVNLFVTSFVAGCP